MDPNPDGTGIATFKYNTDPVSNINTIGIGAYP
jgi:hypothetical protein